MLFIPRHVAKLNRKLKEFEVGSTVCSSSSSSSYFSYQYSNPSIHLELNLVLQIPKRPPRQNTTAKSHHLIDLICGCYQRLFLKIAQPKTHLEKLSKFEDQNAKHNLMIATQNGHYL